ncbi:MAG: deoxynucleoside kinase [Rubricoccaceae bacterium]|nr:deoxynucleoside kinase [Rubricoccaceae bacterium]
MIGESTSHIVLPERVRYIAVEGVIGAGKTSLARMLAAHFGAKLVLEEFEENPFLPLFYSDPKRWAFQTQLAFLANRFRQQKNLATGDLFHQTTIADYTFDKDRVFAHVTLQGDELGLYENLFSLMEANAPVPDLVVYLQSSVDRLMHNITKRGRSYEKNMDRSYIAELVESYNSYFFKYYKSPLLIINVSRLDFVNEPEHFEELVHQVARVPSGTTHFNPPSSMQLDFGI